MAFRVTPRPMCHKGNGLAGDGGLIGSTTHDVVMGFSCYFSFRRVIYVVVLGHIFPLLSSRVSSMSVCVSSMFIDKTEMENRENTQ
jgi:hypothetical protein